jgi:predicted CXXCH cytochrome family protein
MVKKTAFTIDSSSGRPRTVQAFLIVLAACLTCTGRQPATEGEPVLDPHRNPDRCAACHTSASAGRGDLQFDGNVSRLCRSCHDGQTAIRETHPAGVAPSAAMTIPAGFPLDDGRLTCISCHDVAQDCKAGSPDAAAGYKLLRGQSASRPSLLCLACHKEEAYRPFNVHDQVADGAVKTDTCAWCHDEVPDVNGLRRANVSPSLRARPQELCANCHSVPASHPIGSHLGAKPSPEFLWHMSAYELQSRMRMSFEQLYRYASTTRRPPRSIPLDEDGRITCLTCHNPHEKGLLPDSNPRSVGAETEKAVHHRVRAREGKLCIVCHEK